MVRADSGPRVLVVDDEPSIVDAVATSLRYEGFTVDEATTGRRALAQAQVPEGQAIVAAANQLTAGICQATGQRPTRVCTSAGVRAAATAMGLA